MLSRAVCLGFWWWICLVASNPKINLHADLIYLRWIVQEDLFSTVLRWLEQMFRFKEQFPDL